MSRVAQQIKAKILILPAFILVFGAGVAIWSHGVNPDQVHVIKNSQSQTTEISYKGENGKDALTLLKQHAQVQTKHYSFGDFVVSINGIAGNGPKYWTFYINGKEASVGAGAYITKNSDILDWKLQ
ncbi:MAG: DUF4430 domain-containing protein [Candidatus Saccharimonadales bacterium]|jgi:membrane-bound inhibitor of C-type lysozyme